MSSPTFQWDLLGKYTQFSVHISTHTYSCLWACLSILIVAHTALIPYFISPSRWGDNKFTPTKPLMLCCCFMSGKGIKGDLSAEVMKTFHWQIQAQSFEKYGIVKTTTELGPVWRNLLSENLGHYPSCFKNGSFQLTLCTVTANGHGKYFAICR